MDQIILLGIQYARWMPKGKGSSHIIIVARQTRNDLVFMTFAAIFYVFSILLELLLCPYLPALSDPYNPTTDISCLFLVTTTSKGMVKDLSRFRIRIQTLLEFPSGDTRLTRNLILTLRRDAKEKPLDASIHPYLPMRTNKENTKLPWRQNASCDNTMMTRSREDSLTQPATLQISHAR